MNMIQHIPITTTNFILFVGGALLFMIFEDKNLLDGLPIWEKVLNGFFLSVTPRNAGFSIMRTISTEVHIISESE